MTQESNKLLHAVHRLLSAPLGHSKHGDEDNPWSSQEPEGWEEDGDEIHNSEATEGEVQLDKIIDFIAIYYFYNQEKQS